MADALLPTREQHEAFALLYGHFNDGLFGGDLTPPMLIFSRTRSANAHFISGAWRLVQDAETPVDEIALNPDRLRRDPRAVAASLVHEMCHQWQCRHGKPGRRGYHNREFAQVMERCGLKAVAVDSEGIPTGGSTGERVGTEIIDDGPFDRLHRGLGSYGVLPLLCLTDEEVRSEQRRDHSKTPYRGGTQTVWAKPGMRLIDVDAGEPLRAENDGIDEAEEMRLAAAAEIAALLAAMPDAGVRDTLAVVREIARSYL